MSEETKKPGPSDAQPGTPAPSGQAGHKDEGAAAKKPAYVFKIVPADPKNAFDFEDVADK